MGYVCIGNSNHCSFQVVSATRGGVVTIRDLNQGRSVTNDANFVVEQLRAAELLTPGRRLFYYDSEGNLDEITWDESGATGLIPYRPARKTEATS